MGHRFGYVDRWLWGVEEATDAWQVYYMLGFLDVS